MVDLVSEDHEGGVGKLLHGEQGVELGFGFRETLVVFCVNEEHNPAYFGEVVTPETARLCVASQVEGREFDVAYGELFGCGVQGGLAGVVLDRGLGNWDWG